MPLLSYPLSTFLGSRYFICLPLLLWLCSLLCLSPASLAQEAAQVRTLKVGEKVAVQMAGDGKHTYQIKLDADQFLRLIVEQRGIDVVVTLFAPDGNQLLEVDSPNGTEGPEPLAWIAQAAGTYRLEVRSLEKNAGVGRYEINLQELRFATEQDRTLLQADRLEAEAEKLSSEGQHEQAVAAGERALALREKTAGVEQAAVATTMRKLADLYKNKNDYDRAETFYQRALTTLEKAAVPDRSEIALVLTNLVFTYEQKGDYTKAEPLQQRVVTMLELLLGKEHPALATTLNNLARINVKIGNYKKAEDLLQRALKINEQAFGPEHANVAAPLRGLADVYYSKSDYARAEPLYQRALAILEKAEGPDNPYVGNILNSLANIYTQKGDYAKAEPIQQRALAGLEKLLGKEHPSMAIALNSLATINVNIGNYTQAEALLQRALGIQEKSLGPEHPNIAQSLGNLAYVYDFKGDYGKAEQLNQRALGILEKRLGANHPEVATALSNLGSLYQTMGKYAKAEQLYQRAVAINEQAFGANHVNVAISINNLAGLFQARGDYANAETLQQRALKIMERSFGAEHLDIASALNNLATTYSYIGDYAQAETLYQRALAMREKLLGVEHPSVALSLNNLALLYNEKKEFDSALPLLKRALTIWEKSLGARHPNIALALDNLASIYARKGEYDAALPLHERALALREQVLGAQHPNVATSFNNLAALYFNKGEIAAAETQAQHALTIWEQSLGPDHPLVANALNNLMTIADRQGDYARAVAYATRAAEVSERMLALNLVAGSERQRLAYLATYSGDFDRYLTLHLRRMPEDARARDLAISTVLRTKGRVLDATTDSLAVLRRHATPEAQGLLDDLQETYEQLAQLAISNLNITPERRERIKALEAQKEQLEAEISRRSAAFRSPSQPVTLARVKAAIPSEAALVEFFLYRPFDARAKDQKRYGPPHYVAYVLRQRGAARWVELGEQQAIDTIVTKLRAALRNPQRRDIKQLARVADEKLMRPLRVLLGPTKRVLLAPDGALNLIPFSALVDEKGHYLVQHYEFSYLTSGRDLLRLQSKQPSRQRALVMADPDFGLRPGAEKAQDGLLNYRPVPPSNSAGTSAAGLQLKSAAMLAGAYFQPLPGTAREAQSLGQLLPGAKVFTQAQATKGALKQLSGPEILHVATHGFFLEGTSASSADIARGRLADAPLQQVNPLLRSGLALAGANLRKGGDDDGILTAQEAAGLDLVGTKLVVLSACDTGVGEVKNGEGVYGLRRALVLAGSETQVMSLWPVSDKATRELMIDYYRRLLKGQGRSAALRQVQLQMLQAKAFVEGESARSIVHESQPEKIRILTKRSTQNARLNNYSHPYFWACFIQSGEWANLQGQH